MVFVQDMKNQIYNNSKCTYKRIPNALIQQIFLPPEKERALFWAFGLHNAPSHFSTVLFVFSAASLPASAASSTPPPAILTKLSHNCPT